MATWEEIKDSLVDLQERAKADHADAGNDLANSLLTITTYNLEILQKLESKWSSKTDLFTSHLDLRFIHKDDAYPFGEMVSVTRVSGQQDYHTACLINDKGLVVTGFVIAQNEDPLPKLESLLVQLIPDP